MLRVQQKGGPGGHVPELVESFGQNQTAAGRSRLQVGQRREYHERDTAQRTGSRCVTILSHDDSNSFLFLNSKLHFGKPVWACAIHVSGCAKSSQILTTQPFQTIALPAYRYSWPPPRYTSNSTLHNDLNIKTVRQSASQHHSRFHFKLSTHPNHVATALS